ncbi:MAG: PAS domain S-box protein [Phycisphaerales bacterium]|nr:PAS domain S-box protein [Phycisphaerales bacterium]
MPDSSITEPSGTVEAAFLRATHRLLTPPAIALYYLAFGWMWILVTSGLAFAASGSREYRPFLIELAKGLIFIAMTASLLYMLMREAHRKLASARADAAQTAERYEMLFMLNPHPMWVYEVEALRVLNVNEAALRRYGYTRQEFLELKITDFRPPEDVRLAMEVARRQPATPSYAGEWRHLTKGGELIHVEVQSREISYHGKRCRLCTATEITKRVRLEQERAASEQLLRSERDFSRAVLETSGALVMVLDREGRIESFNHACEQATGRSLEEVKGRAFWDTLLPPPAIERVKAVFAGLVSRTGTELCEAMLLGADGGARTIQWSHTVLTDPGGRTRHVICSGIDVTEARQAELQARMTAQRLEFAVEAAGMGAWQWIADTDQTIRVGSAWEGLLGGARDAKGETFVSMVHPEDRAKVVGASDEAMRSGKAFDIEYRLIRPDGREIWVSDSAMPVLNGPGQSASLFGISRDITTFKLAHAELDASQRRLREVFDAVIDPLWDWDVRTDRTTFSPGWEQLIELSAGEYDPSLHTWESRVHPEDLEVVRPQLREVLAGRRDLYEAEYRLRAASGYKWVLSRGRVVERDGSGHAVRMVGGIADITARRRAEEALRLSEENYRRIVETATEGIWIIDAEGLTTFANAKMAEMLGDTAQGMLGKSMYEFAGEDERQIAEANLERRRVGISEPHDFRFRRRDGTDLWAIVSTHAIHDPKRGFLGALAMVTDITARKQEEQRRERLERDQEALLQRLQLMLDRMPVGCILCDPEMRITYLNAAAESIFGFSLSQIAGKTPLEVIVPPAARPEVEEVFARVAGGDMHAHGTFENTHRSGEVITCQWLNTPLFTPVRGFEGVLSMVQDITERQRAEGALRKSEREYRSLFELASDAILIFDPFTEHILDANQRACEMYLMPREQLVGMDLRDLAAVPKQGRERIRQTLTLGRVEGYETVHRRGDGTDMVLVVNAAAVEFGGKPAILTINRDVTERHKAERRQNLMMAELDHRVKNNLAAVLSVADQTMRTSGTIKEFGDAFTGRIRALARMHGVLARSRWVGARLRDLISQALEAYLIAGGQVDADGPEVLLPARAASPVAMALHELATNAAKYGALSTPGGIVSIRWTPVLDARGDHAVKLVWKEHGGPPVTPPVRRGFGTELIEGGIAYELHGSVTLEFQPDGVRCEIIIPLKEDEQPWVTVTPEPSP